MSLKFYNSRQYYTGSNVTVYINNILVGEAAKVDFVTHQNRTPLFGYNAPLFNAIADGQVLVEGTMTINYIMHEYLYAAIKASIDNTSFIKENSYDINKQPIGLDDKVLLYEYNQQQVQEALISGNGTKTTDALKQLYWGTTNSTNDYNYNFWGSNTIGRPDQSARGINLELVFGDPQYKFSSTKCRLDNVFFKGSEMSIAITDDPCIKTYSFIARNII